MDGYQCRIERSARTVGRRRSVLHLRSRRLVGRPRDDGARSGHTAHADACEDRGRRVTAAVGDEADGDRLDDGALSAVGGGQLQKILEITSGRAGDGAAARAKRCGPRAPVRRVARRPRAQLKARSRWHLRDPLRGRPREGVRAAIDRATLQAAGRHIARIHPHPVDVERYSGAAIV